MISKKLKLVITIISAVGLLGLTGCGPDNKDYHFNSKIGEEYAQFWEEGDFGEFNYLKIIRADKKEVLYKDVRFNDLKIESIEIKIGGEPKPFGQEKYPSLIEEAQKQFDEYLSKIKEAKQKIQKLNEQEALDILKDNNNKTFKEKPGVYADEK